MVSTRNVRMLIVAVILLLGGTIAFFAFRPIGVGMSVGSVSILGTDADLKIDRVHIVQNKQGVKNWEMWADTAEVYQKEDHTTMRNIHLKFYPKKGKMVDVTADNGLMENESRNMWLKGNVLIQSPDGLSMRTKALRFFPKEKRVESDEKIFLDGGSFQLSGIGLRGRTDLGEFFLKEKVQAVIHETSGGGLGIHPQSADASSIPAIGRSPSGGDNTP